LPLDGPPWKIVWAYPSPSFSGSCSR
jgi:hypothetical protein